MNNNKKGFTLVELLAVIVILAIVLVIAVPKVMSVIEDSKKATLESTAKMIASSAEKAKVQNTILGKDVTITCDSVAKINGVDYEDCDIDFDENTAKVTIKGKGKFAGLYVCNGTKSTASVTNESCTLVTLIVNTDGGTETTYNTKYDAGSIVTLGETTKEGYTFVSWIIESGEGATVTGNTLKMGTTATKVKATWEEERNFSTDSWETIVRAVKQAETNGTEYPYEVGESKIIQLMGDEKEHTIRVSNTTPCEGLEVSSQTACGFVLEFTDMITYYNMNNIAFNSGGWPASKMYDYLNNKDDEESIYNLLPEDLRNGIIDTYVVSSYGEDTGTRSDGNFESIDKLYLLSPQEIYGSSLANNNDSSNGTSRQLDYYINNGVNISNYDNAIKPVEEQEGWWLRSADKDVFYYIKNDGILSTHDADFDNGVSPAFRLAN